MVTCHSADEERGDLRRVGERFVVDLRQVGDYPHCIIGADYEVGVVGPKRLGNLSGVDRLVVGRLAEADCEGAYGYR